MAELLRSAGLIECLIGCNYLYPRHRYDASEGRRWPPSAYAPGSQ